MTIWCDRLGRTHDSTNSHRACASLFACVCMCVSCVRVMRFVLLATSDGQTEESERERETDQLTMIRSIYFVTLTISLHCIALIDASVHVHVCMSMCVQ